MLQFFKMRCLLLVAAVLLLSLMKQGVLSLAENYNYTMTPTMCIALFSSMNGEYVRRANEFPEARSQTRASGGSLKDCPEVNEDGIVYRTADGFCNNLKTPGLGQSFQPFKRYKPARYQDGICTPRLLGRSGNLLPLARSVRLAVHPDRDVRAANTVLLMQWGQFMDHDLTAAALNQPVHPQGCCQNENVLNGGDHPDLFTCDGECFPLMIPENDNRFKTKCINFIRSRSADDPSTLTTENQREQTNIITAFIDASHVYGNDEMKTEKLRAENGRMATSKGGLLPKGRNEDCIRSKTAPHCFAAGDERAHVFPSLLGMHTLIVRLHNKIVAKLDDQTNWGGEKLFQETRKIVYALIQQITYLEWLPNILSPITIKRMKLGEYNYKYDSNVDPRIASEFSTAAFRFGHSLIPDSLKIQGRKVMSRGLFNNPSSVVSSLKNLMTGITRKQAMDADKFMTSEITDHFFETEEAFFDLISFNIQRGRDHAIATYNDMREFCGLKKITSFNAPELGDAGPDFSSVYEHVDDIELFPGGISERHLPKSLLGETFNCILGRQFNELKMGDRFWYETTNSMTGFTPAQLKSIRDYSLSGILCDTLELEYLQKDPFKLVNPGWNRLVNCKFHRKLNLGPWSDTIQPQNTQIWSLKDFNFSLVLRKIRKMFGFFWPY